MRVRNVRHHVFAHSVRGVPQATKSYTECDNAEAPRINSSGSFHIHTCLSVGARVA